MSQGKRLTFDYVKIFIENKGYRLLSTEYVNAHNKLKMVGLEGFGGYMPAEVSGGMQKRAAIARAMALDPKILFLDEPTSGLDPITSSEFDKLVVNLANTLGIAFVIVSHDLSSICKIAKRVILLYQGKIVAEGQPQELSNSSHPFVKSFFGAAR